MNVDKYTTASQQVIQAAQSLAIVNDQQKIEAAHVLQALLEEDTSVVDKLVRACGQNPQPILEAVQAEKKRLTKVTGTGASQLQPAPRAPALSTRRGYCAIKSVCHMSEAGKPVMQDRMKDSLRVDQTLETVTRLSHVVKRGNLRQRIASATWSIIIYLVIQLHLSVTMSMAVNPWIFLMLGTVYLAWVGYALLHIHRLDNEYDAKVKNILK